MAGIVSWQDFLKEITNILAILGWNYVLLSCSGKILFTCEFTGKPLVQ